LSNLSTVLKPVVGSFNEVLCDLMYDPDLSAFSAKLRVAKSNQIFEKFYGPAGYFEHFKETEFSSLEVIYVRDFNDHPRGLCRDIEQDLHHGLNLDLATSENLEFLHKNGVLTLPLRNTW
jgi:hypothetical protein